MKVYHPSVEIGIALYPDVAFATVHGLTDMFTVATTLERAAGYPGERPSRECPLMAQSGLPSALNRHVAGAACR
jgi:hypothetical protein